MGITIERYVPPPDGLEKEQALALVTKAVEANRNVSFQQGAVVDVRGHLARGKEIIFVGDLHGRLDNLIKIILHNDNLNKLQNEGAMLVILGDAIHAEIKRSLADSGDPSRLNDMRESIVIIQFIMQLKVRFPAQFFYCLGNHDYLSKKFRKGGVMQGWIFREVLKKKYGEAMVRAYEQFIASSPLYFIAEGIVANHAGPCDATYSLDDLKQVAITADEELPVIEQSIWRRWKHYQGTYSYNEEQVNKFLAQVIKQPEAIYLVGHSPNLLYYEEYRIQDFVASPMPRHYMIFAGYDECGYALFRNGDPAEAIRFLTLS